MQFEGNFAIVPLRRRTMRAMTKHAPLALQLCLDDGIASRLLNAALCRKSNPARQPARAPGSSPHPKDIAVHGAEVLLAHVEKRMHLQALRTLRDQRGYIRVRVCGVFDYVIDPSQRQVWVEPAPGADRQNARLPGPSNEYLPPRIHNVDLLNPLSRPYWLEHVLRWPGALPWAKLLPATGQTSLWTKDEKNAERLSARICSIAQRKLQSNPCFQALRLGIASELMQCIGPHVMHLAMRARTPTHNNTLLSSHLGRVWKYLAAFQRLELENPRLLPVLTAWLDDTRPPPKPALVDAVPAMRAALLARGLPPRAWRYLAHHGPRCLNLREGQALTWQRLCNALKALNAARWPALPPRGFISLLSDMAGEPDSYWHSKEGVPGWFWQWTCIAAHQSRAHAPAYRTLCNELGTLAWLVRRHRPQPDANQQRRGLAWLRSWAARQEQIDALPTRAAWGAWLQDVCWQPLAPWHAQPLLSPRALLQEAWAMHNCADSYTRACTQGEKLLVSLRHAASGRRVALIELIHHDAPPHWTVGQVAGPCNRNVPAHLHRRAQQIATVVSQHYEQSASNATTFIAIGA